MIGLKNRASAAEGVLAQPSGDTMILLSPETGSYYTLDEVGARVWELCDGTREVADVVCSIHAEYDAPIDAIQSDVLELLEELAREQLLAVN